MLINYLKIKKINFIIKEHIFEEELHQPILQNPWYKNTLFGFLIGFRVVSDRNIVNITFARLPQYVKIFYILL